MPPAACTPPDPPPSRPGPPPRPRLAALPDLPARRRAEAPGSRAAHFGVVVERLRARIQSAEVTPFDGMVWLAHLAGAGEPRLFSRVSDPVTDLDELYLLDVLSTLDAIGLPRVTVAIWRGSGQPAAVDRRLARDLGERLIADGRTVLDAVLVVNDSSQQVVRPRRPDPPRTAGRARRPDPPRPGRPPDPPTGEAP